MSVHHIDVRRRVVRYRGEVDRVGHPQQQVVVDPARLRTTSGDVSQAADLLSSAYTSSESELAPREASGWTAAMTAQRARTAWGAFVTTLSGSVSGLGDDFNAAAAQYEASDSAAADRLGRGRSGL